MPAETFAWAESSSSSAEEAPRLSSLKYGDGYAESAPDGLNPLTQAWSLQFRAVSKAGGDAIVQFFRDRFSATGGLEYFMWTPLWSTEAIKVTCRSWTRTQLDDPDESDISCRFEREYRP